MESNKEALICASCKSYYQGNYCNKCGEKRVLKKERTLVYFLGQLLNAITFSDSKMLKSFGLLLIKPGFLSKEYILGRRNLYTKPLPLFLIINLLYFFFQPVDTFYSGYYSQTEHQNYSNYAKKIADSKMKTLNLSKVQFANRYNKAAMDYSKTLIILLVFLFSIPLSIVFWKREGLYFNHIIFSLGYISFILLGPILLLSIIVKILQFILKNYFEIIFQPNINGLAFSSLIASFLLLYLIKGLYRFYEQKYIWIIPKALFLLASTIAVIIGYRFLMFLIIIQSI